MGGSSSSGFFPTLFSSSFFNFVVRTYPSRERRARGRKEKKRKENARGAGRGGGGTIAGICTFS